MRVCYKMFRGHFVTWDDLFTTATEFASELGETRLINISHSCQGTDGVVAVWYWTFDEVEV